MSGPVTPPTLQAIPWHQRELFIPYQLNSHVPAAREIAEVQLLLSRTGTDDWVVLQSAQPNVQGFNYHAPDDGEYWFALRHLDAKGQALDRPAVVPQLHLVITTQTGPDFSSPSNSPKTIAPATSTSTSPESSAAGRSPFALNNPFQVVTPVQDWPATNQLPAVNQNTSPAADMPPVTNPYTAAADASPKRTQARFAVDDSPKTPAELKQGNSANLLEASSQARQDPAQLPSTQKGTEWASAGPQTGPLVVNTQTFDVEYELQAVGSWGVGKVELWGTQDEGATWQSFGIDTDNHSPLRVTVPQNGTYGFRIQVEGANSIGTRPPQSGDKPELVVMVDSEQPQAEIVAVEPGDGNAVQQLRIRWRVEDTNLEPRPIGLSYSSYAEGPWSTIAAGLENTGAYVWQIERHIPGRFFLRLEARDTAGNVAAYETPQPIELNQPQPTGTLRTIRPVTDGTVVNPSKL